MLACRGRSPISPLHARIVSIILERHHAIFQGGGMTDHTLLYVTVGSRDEALGLARAVVEARLAACANILPTVTSVYRWQGNIAEEGETAMILKTRGALLDALTAFIRDRHSYTCPCVVAVPILAGNPDFLSWIDAETASPQA
jgi:periplasmic divalent cation tolerance protein